MLMMIMLFRLAQSWSTSHHLFLGHHYDWHHHQHHNLGDLRCLDNTHQVDQHDDRQYKIKFSLRTMLKRHVPEHEVQIFVFSE